MVILVFELFLGQVSIKKHYILVNIYIYLQNYLNVFVQTNIIWSAGKDPAISGRHFLVIPRVVHLILPPKKKWDNLL